MRGSVKNVGCRAPPAGRGIRPVDNADDVLARDVENLVRYFDRKYPAELPAVDTCAVASAINEGAFDGVPAG